MRTLFLPVCLFALSTASFAASFTVNDPFPGSSCSNAALCDVVGSNSRFDIERGVFDITATSATFELFFNFGDANTLASFLSNGRTLYVGDLLFTVDGQYRYGTALSTHGASVNNPGGTSMSANVDAGTFYQINPTAGLLLSNDVMGGAPITYRENEYVWLRNNGTELTSLLTGGAVNVAATGGDPRIHVTITFNAGTPLWTDLQNGGQLGAHFASATCANDVLHGDFQPRDVDTPEPVTLSLIGLGLAGIGLFRRYRTAA